VQCLVPTRKIFIVERDLPQDEGTWDILILNYDKFAGQRRQEFLDFCANREWGVAILDEAHYLKNPKAQRTEAILATRSRKRGPKGAIGRAKKKLFLTGTPILNRPIDLWPMLKTAAPNEFNDYQYFTSRYCCVPETLVWMGDYGFQAIGDVQVGDIVIGWEKRGGPCIPAKWTSTSREKYLRNSLVRAEVLAVHRHEAPTVEVVFASGDRVRCTADHRWLRHRCSGSLQSPCREYDFTTPKQGRTLVRVVDPALWRSSAHLLQSKDYNEGYVAGALAGDGTVRQTRNYYRSRKTGQICGNGWLNRYAMLRVTSLRFADGFEQRANLAGWKTSRGNPDG
ncbi:hypothetical protein LCGC14_3136380, partial [marine sediment metagenome]